jgi:hypothetical protein
MTALQTLIDLTRTADPYRHAPETLPALQLQAIRERFADRRHRIKLLAHRARETGIDDIRSLDDVVPLLLADANYKSYPESFIENGRWDRMTLWLQTLSAHPITGMDHQRVHNMDEWVAELRRNGHHVMSSSGTSGKQSFINASDGDARVASWLMHHGLSWAARNFRDLGNRKLPVFLLMPSGGSYTATERTADFAASVGVPGDIHWISHVPQSAEQTMKQMRLRRAMADGTAKPNDIAAFQAENEARTRQIQADLARFLEQLVRRRNEPVLIMGMMAMLFRVVAEAKAQGISDRAFHPETIVSTGGGRKGADLPADYEEQCQRFFGLGPQNYLDGYGMGEISGFCPINHAGGGWAVPPWLVPLVLDKSGEKLLNPKDQRGTVEGRMAFFDLLADGRWGGIITGDKVVVDFSPTEDGLRVPVIRQLSRYKDLAEGDEKLSCAGTIDAYVRGVVGN